MIRMLLARIVVLCACGTMASKPATIQSEEPLVEWRRTAAASDGLFDMTLRRGGLQDTLFMSSNGAGTVLAAMLDSESPGLVAVMRQVGDDWRIDAREGNLLKGTAPLLGGIGDEADDVVEIEDLTSGTKFLAPLRVTASDAGITEGPGLDTRCCGWWEDTLWRSPARHTDRQLVRATVAPLGTWSVLHAYGPGRAQPLWSVRFRATEGPARIVDVQLTPDGDRVLVQVVDERQQSELVAYAALTGAQLWRARTSAAVRNRGALVVTDDGSQVVSILANPRKCETCEKAEIYDVVTGRLTRDVPLDSWTILSRSGTRGYEIMLGVHGNRLWMRDAARGRGRHSMRVAACTYDSWSLDDGSRREASPEFRDALALCDAPLRLAPVQGGVIGIRATDADRMEIFRLRRAP
ncbi:MAG: hypothetical protein M3680_00580 [Myxococcota bacterium]|nr:hypothetical protein [Myxococcota bacterium]